jgi:hypothetical protein
MVTRTDESKPRSAAQPSKGRQAAVSEAAQAAHAAQRPNTIVGRTPAFIEPERRGVMIAEAAYYRAERRGFEPGHELEDWLTAEGEINGMLTRGELPAACGV